MTTIPAPGAPELPVLPEPGQTSSVIDSVMRRLEVHSFTADQMQAYALEAIALDRNRRAVPVVAEGEQVGPRCWLGGRCIEPNYCESDRFRCAKSDAARAPKERT